MRGMARNSNKLDVNKIIEFFYLAICEDFGRPIRLERLMNENPNMRVQFTDPKLVIDANKIVKWQDWGGQPLYDWSHRKRGTMLGWRQSAGSYGSFEMHRPEFESFVRCDVLDQWSCDIQDVTGLSASKSILENFYSLDSMVETNSRKMIDEITQDKLDKNLAHSEIRILHQVNSSDHFARYRWDGRTLLMNSGGSHHFAAARYIASRINRRVPLHGRLHTYSICPLALGGLLHDFDMYAISDAAAISIGFNDAMRMFRATYLWQHLPRPCAHARAIFLPKNERRSMRVSRALREAGMFDLGAHLIDLTDRQAACA